MKLFDQVKVIINDKSYKKEGVEQGMVGRTYSEKRKTKSLMITILKSIQKFVEQIK